MKAKGIDEVLVYCVNDMAVMQAWFDDMMIKPSSIVTPLADPTRSFTKALDLEMEGTPPQLGYVRSKRFAAVFEEIGIETKSDLREATDEEVAELDQKLAAMGAGAKADPTRWCVAPLRDAIHDPLATKLRWVLRGKGVDYGGAELALDPSKRAESSPALDVTCVFSHEPPRCSLLPLSGEQVKEGAKNFGAVDVDHFRVRVLPVLGAAPDGTHAPMDHEHPLARGKAAKRSDDAAALSPRRRRAYEMDCGWRLEDQERMGQLARALVERRTPLAGALARADQQDEEVKVEKKAEAKRWR